jgi:hypothetical protein
LIRGFSFNLRLQIGSVALSRFLLVDRQLEEETEINHEANASPPAMPLQSGRDYVTSHGGGNQTLSFQVNHR